MLELTLEKAILIAVSLIVTILFAMPIFMLLIDLLKDFSQMLHSGTIIFRFLLNSL